MKNPTKAEIEAAISFAQQIHRSIPQHRRANTEGMLKYIIQTLKKVTPDES